MITPQRNYITELPLDLQELIATHTRAALLQDVHKELVNKYNELENQRLLDTMIAIEYGLQQMSLYDNFTNYRFDDNEYPEWA